MLVEEAVLFQLIATATTVIGDLLTGGPGFRHRAAAFIHMPCTADLALVGFLLDTVLGIGNVLILMAALVCNFPTGRTEFVMLCRRYLPLVIQSMTLGTGFFFLDVVADHTLDTSYTGFRAGCGIAALHFPPVVVFGCAASGAGMLFRGILRVDPQVHFGIANLLHAVVAELDMAAIAQVCKDHICMGAVLHNAAAMAHIGLGAVLVGDGLHPVIDPDAAVDSGYAVANSTAVAGRAAAHIPAIGQGEADGQHIAIL